MNNRALYEDNLFDGGVPKRGVPRPTISGILESEDEVDADFIRHAIIVAAPPVAFGISWDATPPAHLTFHLQNCGDTTLESEGEPSPGTTRPLNQRDQVLEDASQPFSSDPEDEAGQAAAVLMKESLALTQDGSALYRSILAALEFYDAWLNFHLLLKHKIRK
jgi:hypothetical protein